MEKAHKEYINSDEYNKSIIFEYTYNVWLFNSSDPFWFLLSKIISNAPKLKENIILYSFVKKNIYNKFKTFLRKQINYPRFISTTFKDNLHNVCNFSESHLDMERLEGELNDDFSFNELKEVIHKYPDLQGYFMEYENGEIPEGGFIDYKKRIRKDKKKKAIFERVAKKARKEYLSKIMPKHSCCLLEIHANKNILDLRSISKFTEEQEILVGPSLFFIKGEKITEDVGCEFKNIKTIVLKLINSFAYSHPKIQNKIDYSRENVIDRTQIEKSIKDFEKLSKIHAQYKKDGEFIFPNDFPIPPEKPIILWIFIDSSTYKRLLNKKDFYFFSISEQNIDWRNQLDICSFDIPKDKKLLEEFKNKRIWCCVAKIILKNRFIVGTKKLFVRDARFRILKQYYKFVTCNYKESTYTRDDSYKSEEEDEDEFPNLEDMMKKESNMKETITKTSIGPIAMRVLEIEQIN